MISEPINQLSQVPANMSKEAPIGGAFLLTSNFKPLLPLWWHGPTGDLLETLGKVYTYLFEMWFNHSTDTMLIRFKNKMDVDVCRLVIKHADKAADTGNGKCYRGFLVTEVGAYNTTTLFPSATTWSASLRTVCERAAALQVALALLDQKAVDEELQLELYATIREEAVYKVPYKPGQDPLEDVFLQADNVGVFSSRVEDREVSRDPNDPDQGVIVDE